MQILFIGNTRLGDAILSTVVLNHFNSGDAHMTVICSPLSKEIYKNFNCVKKFILIEKKKRGRHWFEVYKSLDRKKWDLVIDLRNTILSRIVRKKKIIRYSNKNKHEHRVTSLANLIKNKYDISLKIPINYSVKKKSRQLIEEKKIEFPILAVAPVTNWKRKNWPLKNFYELINRLVSIRNNNNLYFKTVIILGSKNEYEECNILLNKIKKPKAINLCGQYNISIIYALLRQCNFFIGNDSGLMHLAASSNIPTLGLFGPSRDENYRPWGEKSFYIRTEKTYEELVNNKDYNRHDQTTLMESLSVEKVYKKCLQIIQ